MGALALSDLRELDGEPRVHDVLLGERLGFSQSLDVRKIIRRRRGELERYGEVFATVAKTSVRGGRPGTTYFLNEPQSLLICMFSETRAAADVREQLINIFIAWRRGQLIDADPIARLERRIAQLERILSFEQHVGRPDFIGAVRFTPPVMRLRRPDGSLRNQRNPKHYATPGAQAMVMRLHRQMTIADATDQINAELGETTISRTALGREWKKLDQVRAVQ